MRVIDTIAGVKILELHNSWIAYISRLAIDSDGGPNVDKDPYWQRDTSLRIKGKSVNAQTVPYIVVPPIICTKTKGTVLGSMAYVTNLNTGKVIEAVVADIGPKDKIGEGSSELARRLGLDGNSNHGGTSAMVIGFEIMVGVNARIDGLIYDLQSYR